VGRRIFEVEESWSNLVGSTFLHRQYNKNHTKIQQYFTKKDQFTQKRVIIIKKSQFTKKNATIPTRCVLHSTESEDRDNPSR